VVELRRTDVATGITVGYCAHCCNLETEKYLFECSRSIMCVCVCGADEYDAAPTGSSIHHIQCKSSTEQHRRL